MKYKVVAIRDRAIATFSVPQFVTAVGAAVRSFGDEVRRGGDNNPLAAHPEDFDLFSLGEYDDQTGLFESEVPHQIAVGKDYVKAV